jgi:hypothetical protein
MNYGRNTKAKPVHTLQRNHKIKDVISSKYKTIFSLLEGAIVAGLTLLKAENRCEIQWNHH